MHLSRIRLLVAAAWLAAAAATAAPVPDRPPASQGPISDYLRLRGKLPASEPPRAMKLAVSGDTIEVESITTVPVVEEVARAVQRDGKVVIEKQLVTKSVAQVRKQAVAVKDCKFFEVSRDGKLEPVEAAKVAALLKEPRAVLAGQGTEVDPRNLELVNPGTLYVVFPPPLPEVVPVPLPPPPRRDEK
jgi:hypothetical protein